MEVYRYLRNRPEWRRFEIECRYVTERRKFEYRVSGQTRARSKVGIFRSFSEALYCHFAIRTLMLRRAPRAMISYLARRSLDIGSVPKKTRWSLIQLSQRRTLDNLLFGVGP